MRTHYDSLPAQTIFMHDGPEMHNPNWERWWHCLKPTATYAPMVYWRLERMWPSALHRFESRCHLTNYEGYSQGHLVASARARGTGRDTRRKQHTRLRVECLWVDHLLTGHLPTGHARARVHCVRVRVRVRTQMHTLPLLLSACRRADP